MDQLRVALKWLQAQHFWVLSVLGVLVAIVCWYIASGRLISEFDQNKRQIIAEFTAQSGLQGQPFHANEEIIEKQQQEIVKLAENVEAAWQQLYDRQREEVLQWPAELPAAFRTFIEDRNFGDAINLEMRDHYYNYARDHFAELPKIVDAKSMSESEMDRSGGSQGSVDWSKLIGEEKTESTYSRGETSGPAQDEDYTVIWLDQGSIRQQLTWNDRPSPIRIWVTQEDIWVYHTLLQVIAKTNEAKGSDRIANAAILGIAALQVGQPAGTQSRGQGRIRVSENSSARAEGGSRDSGRDRDLSTGSEGEEGTVDASAAADAAERKELLSGRYLNANGTPISGEGGSRGEFKRLPVYMDLYMDQRWLTQLISECANAPLPVEIQEIRINPQGQGSTDFSGSRRHGGGQADAAASFETQPNLVQVILQGTVYIYNKPNANVLKVADAGSEP
jgi:hypothetical protein